jgi:hypothetical protein
VRCNYRCPLWANSGHKGKRQCNFIGIIFATMGY